MKEYKNSNLFQDNHGPATTQVLDLTVRVTVVVAVLAPISRFTKTIKVIRVVTISNLVRGVSSSSSPDIKVIRSS